MFAGKHREDAATLNQAADRAFAVMLELIEQGQGQAALEPGEPERVGVALLLLHETGSLHQAARPTATAPWDDTEQRPANGS